MDVTQPGGGETESLNSNPPSTENTRVLVVDDEPHICDMLQRILTRMGFAVSTVLDGHSALELARTKSFDIVILDMRMPEMDGPTVCRKLRSFSNAAVIMLSALDRTEDVVHGFAAGADDYMTKPIRASELDSRIRAVLRRTKPNWQDRNRSGVGSRTPVLNYELRRVFVDNRSVQLTAKEFALLAYLVDHADQPVEKSELLRKVWDYHRLRRANLVEIAIHRLRAKIEMDPTRPVLVVTCRPAAYMYVSPGSSAQSRPTTNT